MRDNVTILTNVALTAETEAAIYKTRVDLTSKSAWTDLNLFATITNGSTAPFASRSLFIYFAFSQTSIAPSDAPTILDKAKRVYSISTTNVVSTIRSYNSGPILVLGDYLYIWINHGELGAPITLSLQAVQVG